MLETFKKGLHGMVKWMGESIKRIVHPSGNTDRRMLEGDILLIEEGILKVEEYGTEPKPELTDEEKLGLLAAQCVSNYFEKADELRRCSNKKETQINGRIDIKPLMDGSSPEATPLETKLEFLKNENTFEIEPTIIQVVQLMGKHEELFMELFEQEMQRVDKEILEEKERKEILYYSKILEELEKAHKISRSLTEYVLIIMSQLIYIFSIGFSIYSTYWNNWNEIMSLVVLGMLITAYSLPNIHMEHNFCFIDMKYCLEKLQPLLRKTEFSVQNLITFADFRARVFAVVNKPCEFSYVNVYILIYYVIAAVTLIKNLLMFPKIGVSLAVQLYIDLHILFYPLVNVIFIKRALPRIDESNSFMKRYKNKFFSNSSPTFTTTIC